MGSSSRIVPQAGRGISYFAVALPLEDREGGDPEAPPSSVDQPRMAFKSSSGVVMGIMLKFLTSTSSTLGVTKAGSDGPSRMFLMPRCNRVRRTATAFCSYPDLAAAGARLIRLPGLSQA